MFLNYDTRNEIHLDTYVKLASLKFSERHLKLAANTNKFITFLSSYLVPLENNPNQII